MTLPRVRRTPRMLLVLGSALVMVGCVSGPARRADSPAPTTSATVVASVPPTAGASPSPTTPVTGLPSAVPPRVPTPPVQGQPAPEPVGLVRSDGSPFRLADGLGHPTVLFFGYTHCPDVCPETIATLLEVQRARPDLGIAFVTVDPERDTPAFLEQWAAYMPEGVVGVTGTPAAIRAAADLYGVQYARVETGSAAGYAMAHTASQYLVDGDGVLVRIYPFATPAEAIVRDLGPVR